MKDSVGTKMLDSEFYRAFRVCKRLVWLGWHATEGILKDPWKDESLIHIAKNLFPNAVNVAEKSVCLEEALDVSKRFLRMRKTLFNAWFSSSIGVAVADIIVPLNGELSELIMICPVRGVHPLFIEKIAYTAAVLLKNGIELGRVSLLKINPDYKKTGKFEPSRFFIKQIITGRVSARINEVEDVVSEIYKIMKMPQPPDQTFGKHCYTPFVCPFFENCWRSLPDHNISLLYRGGKKVRKLVESGVFDLTQIPDEVELTEKQRIQVVATRSGQPFINKKGIKSFLKKLEYPLHFLDFETISPAIPIFENTKPFEMIPYAFSLNIRESSSADVKTINYFAETNADPRPEILRILSNEIKATGSIVAYNAGFEIACLKECVRVCPEYSEWFETISERMVDLLKPFRSLDYYHPDQRGSASLKAVLPCLTGRGYSHLTIKNGAQAEEQFLKMMTAGVSAEEKAIIKRQLEEYCYTDSIGMSWIIDAMGKLSK